MILAVNAGGGGSVLVAKGGSQQSSRLKPIVDAEALRVERGWLLCTVSLEPVA
jgi:hypothetical protein